MEKWSGQVAVVTGASVGIGASIAVRLANAGMIVVGAARRANLVQDLQKQVTGSGKIVARKCDFAVPSEIEELFTWIDKNVGGVAVQVNNAGVLYLGTLLDTEGKEISIDKTKRMMDVNVNAYMLCTRAAVRSMNKHKINGHIINMNSVTGNVIAFLGSMPIINAYPASKYAAKALTEVTRQELAMMGSKIRITTIAPGPCRTAMIKDLHVVLPTDVSVLEPEDVAESVVYVLSANARCNVTELTLRHVGEKFN